MDAYDTPRAVERYRRAFEKLTASGSLSASGEVQCEKLRAKLKISEELHERLMSELETPEEEATLELALAWRGERVVECALIHRGDFSLEHIEVVALSTRFGALQRFEWVDLDPGDRQICELKLLPEFSGDASGARDD